MNRQTRVRKMCNGIIAHSLHTSSQHAKSSLSLLRFPQLQAHLALSSAEHTCVQGRRKTQDERNQKVLAGNLEERKDHKENCALRFFFSEPALTSAAEKIARACTWPQPQGTCTGTWTRTTSARCKACHPQPRHSQTSVSAVKNYKTPPKPVVAIQAWVQA